MATNKIGAQKKSDHFYALGTPFFPVYLSLGDDAMLIEGGTGGATSLVKDQLAEIGVAPERVKYMALTHSHFDHIGLVPHLKEFWRNATILAGLETLEAFRNEKAMSQFPAMDIFVAEKLMSMGETSSLAPDNIDYTFNVDKILNEGDKIDLGAGVVWTVLKTQGHSPCQLSFCEEKEGTLAIGDSAGLYFPKADAFWPEYFLSLEVYVASIRRLMSFNGNRTALSHFGVVDGSSNEFLTKCLKATKAYHEEMVDRMKKGEVLETVAFEKAKWVHTNHNYMPFEVTEQMCRLLIKRSLKTAEAAPGLFSDI
jgi:2-aminobenzoylacetyl-CoA thioesterase